MIHEPGSELLTGARVCDGGGVASAPRWLREIGAGQPVVEKGADGGVRSLAAGRGIAKDRDLLERAVPRIAAEHGLHSHGILPLLVENMGVA